ncbi:MAG: sugar transferase [Actinobacteria bacterium]|nr:sugar transferase [Actinomycetota bacterium]
MALENLTSTSKIASIAPDVVSIPSVVDWLAEGWVTPSLLLRTVKRSLDIVLSLVGLILVLPFLALALLVIAIESPGFPLYVQRRVGRYGAPFDLIKLRTMVPRAEERLIECLASSAALMEEWDRARKLRMDPRVTRVGRFLRRLSLDEIPQLINVLFGQMSLVGPRPVLSDEAPLFGGSLPLVLSVRPGLTGLWAVSGRSDLSYQERVALEATYVRECSLRGDLSIIARTIPWVLKGGGAY